MTKLMKLSLITAMVLGVLGCGGSSDASEPDNDRKVFGIPDSLIKGECKDINTNFICDNEEKNVEEKDANRMLLQLEDKDRLKFNDGKFNLGFDGSQTELKFARDMFLKPDGIGAIFNDLDREREFDIVLMDSLIKNLNIINKNLNKSPLISAERANIQVMAEELVTLSKNNVEDALVKECKVDTKCLKDGVQSLVLVLTLDKEEAYAIAQEVRGDKNSLVNDKLIKSFTCAAGEIRTVTHYGLEDVFDTTNGTETATPHPTTAVLASLVAYNNNVNAGFVDYDNTLNNRLFLENIHSLPASITSGRIYIGLKSNGSMLQVNDTLSIGDLTSEERYARKLTDLGADGWHNQLVSSSNPTTDIYWSDFSNIPFNRPTSTYTNLKSYVQTNNHFDVYVQDDTSVDFITVATCSENDPIKEVTSIVNKFECSEQETWVKILGGTLDSFNATTDASATPDSALEANALSYTVYSNVADYDYTAYDYHFVDTLMLGLSSSQVVTQAQFNIGYKVIGSSLSSNDAIYVGDIDPNGSNYAGGHLYDQVSPIIPQGWSVSNLSNYGHVAQVNLRELNTTYGSMITVFESMINKSELDIYVQDDTAVDFTQLNLCVTDNCNENATDIVLDLSQLDLWTIKPSDAVENNVFNGTQYEGVWDNTLNWFEFGGSSLEVLEIPFCACGDTTVRINHLKADNSATVKLDGTLVASQTANNQDAMKRDDLGGTHEDGSLTVPAGTNGGTNHVLRVDVNNLGGEFGVAIDGTLNFRGYLGNCE